MAVGEAYLQYVLEQLQRLRGVTSRRMFRSVGLYCDDVFFAIVGDGTLHFKVDDTTRPDYESRGMQPFRPFENRPEVSRTYYAVPVDVIDDAEELVSWARRSVAAASASRKPVRKRKAPAASKKKKKARRKARE